MDNRFAAGVAPAFDASAVSPAIARERRYGARNYDPLPVVLAHGDGAWLWDEHGKRYLDMMSAYSAVSHGHAHPRLVRTLVEQAQRLAVTSRVFHNDILPRFLERLTQLTGQDRALPANGGAEAVETALKAARKWGHKVKGIPNDRVEIIVCRNNFHGRSITIVGFSTEPQYRDGFGPFPPGFRHIPFGDADALARAIGPHTAAFLVEPIQGEGGIVVPPSGYLTQCARICRERNVLLICDEIQTGMGRTGKFLACEHEHVKPDGVILGKALGGGLLPVSAFVASDNVMQVFTPGDHGSTFGGNPLAAAVGLTALDVLFDEGLIERSAELGAHLLGTTEDDRESAHTRRPRQGVVRRSRSGFRAGLRPRCRRPAARAWHSVEGHARHRRALCAAARHRPRRARLGGRGSARGVRAAGRRIEARRVAQDSGGAGLYFADAPSHARRQARRRDQLAGALRPHRESPDLHRGGRRGLSPLPARARGRAAGARSRVRIGEEALAAQSPRQAVRRGDPAVAQFRRHRSARVQRDQALQPRHHARGVHQGRADVALRAGVRCAPVPVGGPGRRAARARRRLRGGDDLPQRGGRQRDRRAADRVRRRRRALFRRGRARVSGERAGGVFARASPMPRSSRCRAGRSRNFSPGCIGSRATSPRIGARSAPRSSPRAALPRTSASYGRSAPGTSGSTRRCSWAGSTRASFCARFAPTSSSTISVRTSSPRSGTLPPGTCRMASLNVEKVAGR